MTPVSMVCVYRYLSAFTSALQTTNTSSMCCSCSRTDISYLTASSILEIEQNVRKKTNTETLFYLAFLFVRPFVSVLKVQSTAHLPYFSRHR